MVANIGDICIHNHAEHTEEHFHVIFHGFVLKNVVRNENLKNGPNHHGFNAVTMTLKSKLIQDTRNGCTKF